MKMEMARLPELKSLPRSRLKITARSCSLRIARNLVAVGGKQTSPVHGLFRAIATKCINGDYSVDGDGELTTIQRTRAGSVHTETHFDILYRWRRYWLHCMQL